MVLMHAFQRLALKPLSYRRPPADANAFPRCFWLAGCCHGQVV